MVLGNFNIPPVRNFLSALTLDQAWDVFAPNPLSAELELEASIQFGDGREIIWIPPRANPLFALTTYHWELWARAVISGFEPLVRGAAMWLASEYSAQGAVRRVTLRRRWYQVAPPGVERPNLWRESDFFVYEAIR